MFSFQESCGRGYRIFGEKSRLEKFGDFDDSLDSKIYIAYFHACIYSKLDEDKKTCKEEISVFQ